MRIFFTFYLLSLTFSCSKSNSPELSREVVLRFVHKVAGESLRLQTQKYLNSNGDTFSLNQFDYYLSQVKFFSKNTAYSIPNSYHLIRVPSDGHVVELRLKNIPLSDFDRVEFGLGVDSLANAKTDRIGDLDPSNGMAWNWLTGYKFVKLEGYHFKKDGTRGGLVFHIGTNPNYRLIRLDKTADKNNSVEIEVDIFKIFSGKHLIDLAKINQAMFGQDASLIADNCATMFE